MKLITAMIQPYVLDEVKEALQAQNITGLTATEVRGYGRQQGHTELYRGTEYRVDFVPKVKLEIAVDDAELEIAIETITDIARTGKFGDGKVFVSPLEQVFRIRTGESGQNAL